MSQITNKVNILTKGTLRSLFLALVLVVSSTGLAQISIVDQLVDFVNNTNIEFMINNQSVGQQIPVYAENQDVGFSIVSQTSGYHYLYVVNGEGSSSIIYPNQFETESYIQAGVTTNFPDNTSNNPYRLIAQPGQGTDFHIVSIVSPTPLTGFTIGFTNGFNIIPPPTQVIPGYQAAAMRYRVQESTNQTMSSCSSNCLYLNPTAALVQPTVFAPTTPTVASSPTTVNTGVTAATQTNTGAFQGYASYQEYLDNFYVQNNTVQNNTVQSNTATPTQTAQSVQPTQLVTTQPTYTYTTPATTYTPSVSNAVTVAPTTNNYSVTNYATNAGTFQGFASYQAYLDNYYAQNGTSGQTNQTATTTVAPTPALTPVTVYTIGATGSTTATNFATTTPTPVNTTTNTGAFQGFASYQAYLDNFYAQNPTLNSFNNNNPTSTTSQPQQPVTTDPFQGFGSYDAYLANYQATVGQTNVGTSTTTVANNYSVYNVVPTQTTQTPNYTVDYSITQQQFANTDTNYTQLTPVSYTQLGQQTTQATTVNTNYNQAGFFDFEVGQNYTLFNSLGLTVLSIQDNRCPAGVQCFQAGNVITTIEIQFANVKRSFTITLLAGEEPTIGVGNSSLRFIGLSNNSNTALRVYVATQ